jgi:hydrogenase expression/formation protein HypE
MAPGRGDGHREAARTAGVPVVTGDTKVVERGKCDSMYVVTTGLGVREHDVALGPEQVPPGGQGAGVRARSGPRGGDHAGSGDLDIEADVRSDTRPLWTLAEALLDASGLGLHCMRDATRGGVATVLNEIALAAEVGVVISEDRVPLRREVVGAGEILGIDPLYVANEGKLVAFVAADRADAALAAARSVPAGADAALIGEVRGRAAWPGAGPDRLRRPPDDRHAGRRPAAADLLTAGAGGVQQADRDRLTGGVRRASLSPGAPVQRSGRGPASGTAGP